MESLGINKTLLNQFISLLEKNQCTKCQDNSTSTATRENEDPERLLYVLLLMGAFAFFKVLVVYWKVSSKLRGHSKDPYHTYIKGRWEKEEDQLAHQRLNSVSLTIGNQSVGDPITREEDGELS